MPNPSRHNNSIAFKASAGDDSGIKSITIQISTDKIASEWSIETKASCDVYGIKVQRCSECNEIIKTEIIEAKYTCFVCGDVYDDDYVEKLGHDIVYHSAKEADCVSSGWNAYESCDRCDYSTFKEIPAKGHSIVVSGAINATCTTEGKTEGKYCEICGLVITEQKVINATGHNYIEKIVEPSCIVDGSISNVCINCGDTNMTIILSSGHEDANKDGRCDSCGEFLEQTLNCSHICHKKGFAAFIWKILNFFNKIFKKNKTCECGVLHY